MLDRIVTILQQQCKIDANTRLLVGVSGGPDSLCLLHILQRSGYPVRAVHVNHRLRPEADGEVKMVENFATGLGVEFVSIQRDVLSFSHQRSISIEEAARILRYEALFEQARSFKAGAVVVAHTADDQVETILMHLLRGTGLSGLRGMEFRLLPNPWSQEIPLARPFLSTWRQEIEQYIAGQGLKPISDKSNQDISFFRNRIRHELLPLLESYNPSIRESLLRLGESFKEDYSFLQELVEQAWKSLLLQQGSGYQEFNTAGFLALPLSIQRYVLRKAIDHHLPGLRDVGLDCIDRGRMLLAGELPGDQTDLIAGIRLIKEGDHFWLLARDVSLPNGEFPTLEPGRQLRVASPSQLDFGNGWQLDVEEVLDPDLIKASVNSTDDLFQAWMDVSDLPLPLIARSRLPGDQIRLIGMDGHAIKISDLMINLKLPKRLRVTWPLICAGEEVLWVPGYRLSHRVRIKPDSPRALHLTLRRAQVA